MIKKKTLIKTTSHHIYFIIIFTLFIPLINTPLFYNLYHIISSRHSCKAPPPATLTIVTMVTWVTYCSITISILTRKAITFIRICDEFRKERFGKEDKTNVRRIVVMKRLWFIFSLLWLPYGFVNTIQNFIPNSSYEVANAISRIIAFLSFTVISAVFYMMDKNYANYINKQYHVIRDSFRKGHDLSSYRIEMKEVSSQISGMEPSVIIRPTTGGSVHSLRAVKTDVYLESKSAFDSLK